MRRWWFEFYCLAPQSTLINLCVLAESKRAAMMIVFKEFEFDDTRKPKVIECPGCIYCKE